MTQQTTTPYIDKIQDVPASQKGRWYSDDDISNLLVDHYKRFDESVKKERKEKFKINLQKAKTACEDLYRFLYAEKIKCKSIHLRYTSLAHFDAIGVLPEKDYLSKSFDLAFGLSLAVRNHFKSKDIDISFKFMPETNKVNTDALVGDGYTFTYGNTRK